MYVKKVKFVSSSGVFWSIFVRHQPFRLSVCPYMFSHCLLLLQNHWDDFNQTWPKTTLGERGIVYFFFYMKGHAFFKGMQFVFIDTLLLLFKESSSQKPLNQKSCILCRNILRWCRFTFVHIMIPVGSVGPRWVQGFNFLHRNMLRIFFLQYSSQQASGQKCCDMCGVVLVQMCENHDPRGLDGVTRARGQIFRQEYIEKMNNPHF